MTGQRGFVANAPGPIDDFGSAGPSSFGPSNIGGSRGFPGGSFPGGSFPGSFPGTFPSRHGRKCMFNEKIILFIISVKNYLYTMK